MDIVIFEKIVPVGWRQMTRVMENKLEVRGALPHDMSHVAIEDLQGPLIGGILWFVDGLYRVDCRVVAPFINQTLNRVLGPKQRLEVDVVVTLAIPGSHPLANLDLMVDEVGLIDPGQIVLHA